VVVPGEGVVVPGGCSSPAKRPLSTCPRAAAAAAAQQSSGSESERERERGGGGGGAKSDAATAEKKKADELLVGRFFSFEKFVFFYFSFSPF
jgi:hypothetical protein